MELSNEPDHSTLTYTTKIFYKTVILKEIND